MLAAVQMNDPGVVDHLGVHDERIPRLHDLVVAVVGIRQHRRPGGEERQTLILKAGVLRALARSSIASTRRRLTAAAAGVRAGMRPSGGSVTMEVRSVLTVRVPNSR